MRTSHRKCSDKRMAEARNKTYVWGGGGVTQEHANIPLDWWSNKPGMQPFCVIITLPLNSKHRNALQKVRKFVSNRLFLCYNNASSWKVWKTPRGTRSSNQDQDSIAIAK